MRQCSLAQFADRHRRGLRYRAAVTRPPTGESWVRAGGAAPGDQTSCAGNAKSAADGLAFGRTGTARQGNVPQVAAGTSSRLAADDLERLFLRHRSTGGFPQTIGERTVGSVAIQGVDWPGDMRLAMMRRCR
jgi:hypothetical protein